MYAAYRIRCWPDAKEKHSNHANVLQRETRFALETTPSPELASQPLSQRKKGKTLTTNEKRGKVM